MGINGGEIVARGRWEGRRRLPFIGPTQSGRCLSFSAFRTSGFRGGTTALASCGAGQPRNGRVRPFSGPVVPDPRAGTSYQELPPHCRGSAEGRRTVRGPLPEVERYLTGSTALAQSGTAGQVLPGYTQSRRPQPAWARAVLPGFDAGTSPGAEKHRNN